MREFAATSHLPTFQTPGQRMNTKRKGNRLEHKSRRLLEAVGYRITRAAASLGTLDLVGGQFSRCCARAGQGAGLAWGGGDGADEALPQHPTMPASSFTVGATGRGCRVRVSYSWKQVSRSYIFDATK